MKPDIPVIPKPPSRWADYTMLILLPLVIAINIYSLTQLRSIIVANQNSTMVARKANIDRQEELKAYFKCIVLLGDAKPPITAQSTRQEKETALDKCAATTKKG